MRNIVISINVGGGWHVLINNKEEYSFDYMSEVCEFLEHRNENPHEYGDKE